MFDLWEELLKKDSLSTDEDEKDYGEYYSIIQNSREDNVEERLNEAAPFVVPAKLEYFRKRIELCSERDMAAESDIGRFDEAVHFALLDLNCCREVALYGLDIEDRNFENVSCILNNGLLFGLRSDISHVVAELLYFYRECIENRSEKRAELAKDLILYALESREYDVPEELLDELREDSVIG